MVEDDLAQYIVEAFIQKCNLEQNKRIQVLPIGGYDNTLDLHQNLLEDRVFSNVTHIISIIDGDVKEIVLKKKNEEKEE